MELVTGRKNKKNALIYTLYSNQFYAEPSNLLPLTSPISKFQKCAHLIVRERRKEQEKIFRIPDTPRKQQQCFSIQFFTSTISTNASPNDSIRKQTPISWFDWFLNRMFMILQLLLI